MKNYIIIAILLVSNYAFGQSNGLFKIFEDGKNGFINNLGGIVIKPKYLEAGKFSDGLASFRNTGKYGFINTKGKVVIPAKYDFVGNFKNGLVDVYQNGEITYINKQGVEILPKNFTSINFVDESICIYTTNDKKSGLYNYKTSSFILKSQDFQINNFNNNLAIVVLREDEKIQYGVINKLGDFIVKFGIYKEINNFVEGYALVKLVNSELKDNPIEGVINTNGELLFKRPSTEYSYLSDDFHDGYAVVSLDKYWIKVEKDVYDSQKSYYGYINLKGKVVLDDSKIDYISDFSNNRAFIRLADESYNIVDTDLKVLNREPFSSINSNGFSKGHAIVKSKKGWGIIDTNMNYIVKPGFDRIHDIGLIENLYVFSIEGPDDLTHYGIKDLKGNMIFPPTIDSFNMNGFENGLLQTIINKKLTYINSSGKIIWQEKIQDKINPYQSLNITHLNRGYFYAYSKTKNGNNSGGWSVSKNEPRVLPISDKSDKNGNLVLEENNYKLYMKNYSNETIVFDAQDNRIDMLLQAKNKDGKWQDIEYLPSSWCGNSYHSIELPVNNYWQFNVPKYEGDFKTLIRAKISYLNPKTEKFELLYSNEFIGGINSGQFWRKSNYNPSGIMDPYND